MEFSFFVFRLIVLLSRILPRSSSQQFLRAIFLHALSSLSFVLPVAFITAVLRVNSGLSLRVSCWLG